MEEEEPPDEPPNESSGDNQHRYREEIEVKGQEQAAPESEAQEPSQGKSGN